MSEITVYRFGMLAPLDWGADCEAETDRMRALWNKLVEIDHAARNAVLQVGADDPAVIAATTAAEARDAEWLALDTERRRRKASRLPNEGGATQLLADARAARREAWAAAKEARRDARGAHRDKLRAIEEARRASVKAARQSSGLWWGNYNAVIASYETARQRAIQTGGELRFRSARRRDCRIVNQIQGGVTPAGLTGGEINQASIVMPGDRWPKAKAPPSARLLIATVYTSEAGRRTCTWPMFMDRPFPDGAIIKEIVVTRRMVHERAEWSVSFLLRVPAAEHAPAGDVCGIDVGWRRLNDGIRVATIATAGVGRPSHVILPERIVSGWTHAESLRSDIDGRTNIRRARIAALPWRDAPPDVGDLVRPILAAPKFGDGALARVVALWQSCAWQEAARADAERDVRDNRRDRREIAGLMLRLTRARRDWYRQEAGRIADRHGIIGMEAGLNIAVMAHDAEGTIPAPSHRYRQMAAPGDFMALLRQAARTRGGSIHEHRGKSTWVCADCGTEQQPRDPAALIATCPHCGATWDQDWNAARNILASTVASAPLIVAERAALAQGVGPAPGASRYQRMREAATRKASARAGNSSTSNV